MYQNLLEDSGSMDHLVQESHDTVSIPIPIPIEKPKTNGGMDTQEKK